MRRHPVDGERIVAAIPELAHLAPAIRAEHERWDGTGYPDGLAGEEIPIASRIVLGLRRVARHDLRSPLPGATQPREGARGAAGGQRHAVLRRLRAGAVHSARARVTRGHVRTYFVPAGHTQAIR